ncbi:hypothetical protein VTK73DRAFT_3262 [Phialemonium thermophilum]|uniref:BHLH domain-containing protein n=1 Tax=Phialemonium thermophilum TaxID=223376 RepID=A0ABR3Y918_9PEZI
MMEPVAWGDGMQTSHDDEFQQFLDMCDMANLADGMQFDLHDFQNHSHQTSHQQHPDTTMSGVQLSPTTVAPHMPPVTSGVPYQTVPTSMIPAPTPAETIVDSIDAQIQFLQQQKLEHQRRQLEEQQAAFMAQQQSRAVPPTPQSLELQAGSNPFYSNTPQPDHTPQQRSVDYPYQRLKDQQEMAFTPLVSPAVTPLDTHFSIDTQFTVPGAYFSPLTSPALHAQNDNVGATVFDSRQSATNTSSPEDMDLETTIPPVLGHNNPTETATKKPRKASAKRGKAGVRQSPITKPQRKKTATPVMNAQMLCELAETAECYQPQQLPVPALPTSAVSLGLSIDSENNSSVSPETLNDPTTIAMPPPPVPKSKSARPSPRIGPENHEPRVSRIQVPSVPSPATPASLMNLSSPSNRTSSASRASSHEQPATEHIDNFTLPESAGFPQTRPQAASATSTPLASRPPSVEDPGSMASSSATPSSSAVFAKPTSAAASANPSPQLTPTAQGPAAATGAATKKTPQLSAKGSKKRGSISSVHVSPALRPRISPNIMPLLPGGPSAAEDAASHLLATKSNYQRILEGNTVPGVSYPSDLSTNLTSKRTSHKIAEQGRRNRINSALQEMAALLPRPPPKEMKESSGNEGDNGGGGGGGNNANGDKKEGGNNLPGSKASTVELAIEYIKQLKKEVAEATRRAEEAEKRLKLRDSSP